MAGTTCGLCGSSAAVHYSGLCHQCSRLHFVQSMAVPGAAPVPAPPKELPTVKSTEPIVGYRVWNLNRKNMRLVSCWKKYEWPLRKRLERDDFDTMGIHAVKDTKRIVGSDPNVWEGVPGQGLWQEYSAEVAGSIWMWGEVKESADGCLAQYAYPKQLWMPEETDPCVILELEENYGVPVEMRPELKKTSVTDGTVPINPGQIQYYVWTHGFAAPVSASFSAPTSGSYTTFI